VLGNMNDTQLLPDDLAACQTIVVQQRAKISEQEHAIAEKERKLSELDHTFVEKARKLRELEHTTVEQARAITELHQKVQEQDLLINELLQRAYRNRSERYREDPDQMKLDFGSTPEAADAAEGLAQAVEEAEVIIAEHKRRRRKPRKARSEAFPAHLPRREVTLDVPEDVKHCATHGERTLFGYDRQETLVI